MATADEILAAAHIHGIFDSDAHYTIDATSRTLQTALPLTKTIVQYDHNSEVVTFSLQRYVDGHDMLLCNVVKVHYLNIDGETKEQHPGIYEVTDLQQSATDENTVVCSWTITRNATQLVGVLAFAIHFACIDENGEEVYGWGTVRYESLPVSQGINNTEVIVEEYADILEQWRQRLFGETGVEAQVLELQRQVAQIRADLDYVPIAFGSIGNDVVNDIAEIGSTIAAVTVTWTLNKEPASLTVDGTPVSVSDRSAVFRNISADKTVTVTATDERDATATERTGVRFLNGLYYGSLAPGAAIDSAALLGLRKMLHSTRTLEFSVTPGAGERPVYACPARYGNPTFKIGGFEYEWETVSTFAFTNASGYTENYAVWMHGQDVSGSITVKVT